MTTFRDRIIDYLKQHPEGADDDELAETLGLRYRQQANSCCRDLAGAGLIERRRVGGKIRNYYVVQGEASVQSKQSASSQDALNEAHWVPLAKLTVFDLPGYDRRQYGGVPGAYAFRNGDTREVLYIGGTKNLRGRLFGNYVGGIGGQTTQRIHRHLCMEGSIEVVEVAWWETDGYLDKEAELKRGRLPTWNRR